jgi:phytanoyl-CoA hydroxylase
MTTLTTEQREHFDREGYVVVRGAIDADRWLTPLLHEYEQVLDSLARKLHAEGRLSRLYDELPFGERFVEVCAETNETNHQYFDFSLPQSNIRHDTPMWHGPAVFDMLRCPELLDLVEGFIGPEIYSNPVQHVRIKVPESREPRDRETGVLKMGATNWHQDNGVVTPDADDTQILTVWFPLRYAGVEHGCLQVVPKTHQRGLMAHCPAGPGGLQVPEKVASRETAVALPMEPGDLLFIDKMTLHNSLPNTSNEIRISFDLRYNPIGQPTGRGAFPGFVARSRTAPETELHDATEWSRMWVEAREMLAEQTELKPFNRWSADAPVCA